MKARDPYTMSLKKNSYLVALDCSDSRDRTVQSQKDETDINILFARIEAGAAQLPVPLPPRFMDATSVPTFQESLDMINEASKAFMALPAKIRKQFDNDPGQFVEFCEDPANLPEMRTMGLAVPGPEATPPVVVPPAA
ncbi:MAG: internal scaffolding protein [Microvirus sp.]|nr:MAG: internal scaffolding protein [Microvirus sp.]